MKISAFKTIVIIAHFLFSLNIYSQTKEQVFTSIQKLVEKATGEKVKSNDVFSKKDDQLGKQLFSKKEVTIHIIPEGKSKNERITRSTEIIWNDFFDYEIYTKTKNLLIVKLNFKKKLKKERFTSDKMVDKYPSTSSSIEFYVLTVDENALNLLLDRLYDLREKTQESPFNAQIRKFTKQETVDWLKEKLKNTVTGSGLTSLKLLSIDECNLVYEYTNFVGRKYKETIPTAIEAIDKYNHFTYNNEICISLSYAFGKLIQPNDETSYSTISKLSIYSEDDDFISNIECAMKHLASYCNNPSSNKISVSTTKNSIDNKNEDKNTDDTFKIYTIKEINAFENAIKKYQNSFTIDNIEYNISSTNDFADFLNKNTYAGILWHTKNSYEFETFGKTDFSKKSLEFTVKNNKLFIKANIPLNGNCDYGLKEFQVIDKDKSTSYKTAETQVYYLTLNFNYECNGIVYKDLTIYIEDKTLGSYEKVKALFATYGKN